MQKGLSSKNFPGFFIQIDDPEDLGQVGAYCRLSEYHVSIRTQAVAVSFECWRSVEAWKQDKKAFSLLNVELQPDKGGAEFFKYCQAAEDGQSLEHRLTRFCLNSSSQLQSAQLEEVDD
jgi:hypothetical protein